MLAVLTAMLLNLISEQEDFVSQSNRSVKHWDQVSY